MSIRNRPLEIDCCILQAIFICCCLLACFFFIIVSVSSCFKEFICTTIIFLDFYIAFTYSMYIYVYKIWNKLNKPRWSFAFKEPHQNRLRKKTRKSKSNRGEWSKKEGHIYVRSITTSVHVQAKHHITKEWRGKKKNIDKYIIQSDQRQNSPLTLTDRTTKPAQHVGGKDPHRCRC